MRDDTIKHIDTETAAPFMVSFWFGAEVMFALVYHQSKREREGDE